MYDTETLTLKGSIENNWYRLNNIDVSTDGGYYAAAYGNTIKDNLFNPDGHFAIYTQNSECIFASSISQKPFSGIVFNDLNPDQILVWGPDFAEVWDWKKGVRLTAPILSENIESAAFGDNGMILIDSGDNYVQYFELSTPLPQDSINVENIPVLQEPQVQSDSVQLPEGYAFLLP